MRRKAFLLLLIGIFVLSGCRQSDDPLAETVDTFVSEKTDTNVTETDNKAQTEDTAKEDENNEPSEDLPKPSEVPVNTKAEDILYHSEDGIDPGRAVRRCESDGENIYLVYGEPDLYVMPIGADEHSRANIDNPKGMDVCNIAMDTYGRIHLLMADSNGDEWFIWRLDEDYQIDKVIDISAYFETKQLPGWFLIDEDGTYYLQWPNINRDGIIVDCEGALKYRFTPKSFGTGWIYAAAVGKDGQIYLVHSERGETLEIGELDEENCSMKKEVSPLCFPGSENFTAMFGGTDTNLLLYSPYSGVWACDTENGVMENRVPLSDIGSGSGMDLYPLTFMPDGRLLLLCWTGNDYYLKYIPVGK